MIPLNNSTQFEVLAAVQRERQHQEQKYGPLEARTETFGQHLQVLSKELDEVKVALATNDMLSARCELMQVAAVAVAMLERFGVSARWEWPSNPRTLEFPLWSMREKTTFKLFSQPLGYYNIMFPEHDDVFSVGTIALSNLMIEDESNPAGSFHITKLGKTSVATTEHFYYPLKKGQDDDRTDA